MVWISARDGRWNGQVTCIRSVIRFSDKTGALVEYVERMVDVTVRQRADNACSCSNALRASGGRRDG